LRTYVVAGGDIKVYLFRHILALFSAKPYGTPGSDENEDVDLTPHLTNTCLQAEHDERYVRRLDELVGCRILDILNDYGTFTSDDRDSILEQISDTLAEVFRAAVQMPVHFQVSVRSDVNYADEANRLVASAERLRTVRCRLPCWIQQW
jgi:hypothetical protein